MFRSNFSFSYVQMGDKRGFVERNEKVLKSIGYSIGKTIGKGTYSKVCVAADNKGRKLACKIIKKKLAGSDFIEKFLPREIEIITAINHPNIVQVYKILESEEVIYMLMDYCRHGDLLEYIKDYGSFSENKAKYYFKQIVNAVDYLHNLDVAHRDLKCENVFLMWNNQIKLGDFGFARSCKDDSGRKALSDTFCGSAAYAAPEILKLLRASCSILQLAHRDLKCENVFLMWNNQIKLGDFGFARSCKDDSGRKALSDTFCGSAAYAAPEILKGISYDPKMYDMWALGCILYIMITASMPFEDHDIKKMIRSQMSRSIFTITLLWPEQSASLKKLLNQLLEPDLDKRITIALVKNHSWFQVGSLKKIKKLLSISDTSLF